MPEGRVRSSINQRGDSVRRMRGFTLIELMIVVAIVAILATIAYPSYIEHVRKTRRAQAMTDILQTTQNLERVYTTDHDYTKATAICGQTLPSPLDGDTSVYQLTPVCGSASSYTITATPQGAQAEDRCGALSIDQTGRKQHASGTDQYCKWGTVVVAGGD
jgi:type IV pilus assembly protein PilE